MASIRLVNDSSKDLRIAFHEQSTGCERSRSVPAVKPGAEAQHVIAADRELTFEYYLGSFTYAGYATHHNYCRANLRFVPRAGRHYVFHTQWVAGRCSWQAVDATNPARPVPVPLARVPVKQGWDENSSHCDK